MTSPIAPPEFSHAVPLSEIGGQAARFKLAANEAERAGLARRFGLLSLEMLAASAMLRRESEAILVEGSLDARLTQACVATGALITTSLVEDFAIRFLPDTNHAPDAEIELGEADCDTMFHDGRIIDLGEAVAQTLALAIDPFPRSLEADAVLKQAGVKGEHEAGPFAALAALRKTD